MNADLKGGGSLTATISARYGPTGRLVDANGEFARIQSWANEPTKELILNNPAYKLLSESLESTVSVQIESEMILFRGRPFEENEVPKKNEFGPPPISTEASGRYGIPNETVLYLCESEQGVLLEFLNQSQKKIWCQRFVLPVGTMRVGDFREIDPSSILAQVFWFAELQEESGGQCATFLFSQHVSKLCSEYFDMILVPGVRGHNGYCYHNAIVFRSDSKWPSWLDLDFEPMSL